MAQWDVHPNPATKSRAKIPYLVVVQSDLLDSLPTRLVVPLSRSRVAPRGSPLRLAPTFDVMGEALTLKPHEAGTVPARSLEPAGASLRGEWSLLVDAIDAVVNGV